MPLSCQALWKGRVLTVQVIVNCVRRQDILPAPTTVTSGEDSNDLMEGNGNNLMEGTADNGPEDEEDVEVWEDDDKDAEEVDSDESVQTADDEPDDSEGAWMETFFCNFDERIDWG